MKKAVILILFIFLFCVPVKAQELYDVSGMQEIEEALPEQTKDIFSEFDIDVTENLDTQDFLALVLDFMKNGVKEVFSVCGTLLAFVIISSLMSSFSPSNTQGAVETVCMLCACTVLITGIYSCINSALQTLKGAFAFMTAAVPVYMGIMVTASRPAGAASTGGVLLVACQVMSTLFTFVLAPIMNGYLAVGMCCAFAGEKGVSSLMNSVRKVGMWIYSLCTSIFLFLLSVNSVTSGAKDTLVMKTFKFVLGTTIPVAGAALSESASTVAASVNLLKGSVGIYILISVAVIILPLVCSLICWRVSLLLIKNISEIFSCTKLSLLFSSCESVVALLMGFVLLSLALLIISMGVMIKL